MTALPCCVPCADHLEQLGAGVVKVIGLAFPPEKSRRCAEIATHGATDRRNDSRCGIACSVGHAETEDSEAEARKNLWVHNGSGRIFAKKAPHPGDTFASYNVVSVDQVFDAGSSRHMPAHHNRRRWRQHTHAPAHLLHFAEV